MSLRGRDSPLLPGLRRNMALSCELQAEKYIYHHLDNMKRPNRSGGNQEGTLNISTVREPFPTAFPALPRRHSVLLSSQNPSRTSISVPRLTVCRMRAQLFVDPRVGCLTPLSAWPHSRTLLLSSPVAHRQRHYTHTHTHTHRGQHASGWHAALEPLRLCCWQINHAKSLASNMKMTAILGKEDEALDSLSRCVWRQHPFKWREMLEFSKHGEPPRPIELWTMLQLLYVQFEPSSPNARGERSSAAKLEHLENESRRIEGLFTVRTSMLHYYY